MSPLDNPLRRHTVTVIDRVKTGEDDYGADVYEDVERQVADCNMQPVSSTEANDNRTQVITRWRLAGPPGMGLTPTSRVRFRGELYEVDGEPGEHESFASLLDHTEVFLKRVSG
ncbi:head-tail adaptor protein [Streptomyces luteogriseus]|uniref:head-tail adaptor protein n=1 Tax=Streptomyces luteogriseus TaxID=68233 RepID=UPI0038078BCB